MRECVWIWGCRLVVVVVAAGSVRPAVAGDFTVGGAVYVDVDEPLTSGLQGVAVTVEGGGATFAALTAGSSGVWFVENVPEGVYSVTPVLRDWCFRLVVGGSVGDPPPLSITVDADHRAQNMSIQFLARQDGCASICGDGTCDADENCDTCPQDCVCDCHAIRDLSAPALSYCPGRPKRIRIFINPPEDITAIGVEDSPPSGWAVSNIDHGGIWEDANGKVKWGPFFEPFPSEVSYDVTPPVGDAGPECFAGTLSLDGQDEPICGDDCVDPHCCPPMAADQQQQECRGCSGCAGCGLCEDRRIVLCEMTGYACAWRRGCNDDLAGMTRAAFVWKAGECYCWQEEAGFWFPTACPARDQGCCAPAGTMAVGSEGGRGAIRELPEEYSADAGIPVTISVVPPAGTLAFALEESLPEGWTAANASDGGSWVLGNNTVRWGPFFEPFPSLVSYELAPPPAETGAHCLSGSVSFDGFNEAIGGDVCTRDTGFDDSDGDGDVDIDDYSDFWQCAAAGDESPASAFEPASGGRNCLTIFDSNADGDVGLVDWGTLQTAFAGSE